MQGTDIATLEAKLAATDVGFMQAAQTSQLLDIHKISAALIYGTLYHQVTKEQRGESKRRLFMALYTPGTAFKLPPTEQLRKIWTVEEILQLQADTLWDGTQDFWEHLSATFTKMMEPKA